jgi:hypothetical protein
LGAVEDEENGNLVFRFVDFVKYRITPEVKNAIALVEIVDVVTFGELF